MRRTTIRLDEALLAEAKQHAARTGRSLTQLIEDALREVLARRPAPRRDQRVKLPTTDGNGPQRGADLDDDAALRDFMDELR